MLYGLGPHYASGRQAALRAGPRYAQGRGAGAGRTARRLTNYCVTAQLDLRTNGQTMLVLTNGHRDPARLESTAGFMNSMLRLRLGVGLDRLESTLARDPAGTDGPTLYFSVTGRRRRPLRAEPERAGPCMLVFWESDVFYCHFQLPIGG